jgi:hypothetical protein
VVDVTDGSRGRRIVRGRQVEGLEVRLERGELWASPDRGCENAGVDRSRDLWRHRRFGDDGESGDLGDVAVGETAAGFAHDDDAVDVAADEVDRAPQAQVAGAAQHDQPRAFRRPLSRLDGLVVADDQAGVSGGCRAQLETGYDLDGVAVVARVRDAEEGARGVELVCDEFDALPVTGGEEREGGGGGAGALAAAGSDQ